MPQQKTATLATIFSDVLADLAFMFTADEFAASSPDDVWIETTICYHGPQSGELRLRCTRDFSALLAANLLGVESAESADSNQAEDAVKEFMNIICGQFVTAQYGTDDVFNLTIPVVEELDQAPDLTLDDACSSSTISVEGHSVQLVHSMAG